ncbi:TonB-dependent receptor [Sphingomonas lycopersici]|uniref:TonB-dependent receptor n=1 Tax=Sphingomonas lycopersici TaxID=2951807 RepID=A0AA41Z732_9SPHN|nr:TonB-dependent receptor [Sphingomonas lycopersici]MCW6534044.1 TonB-dependent receptor [Sphingomonas lycopersici]
MAGFHHTTCRAALVAALVMGASPALADTTTNAEQTAQPAAAPPPPATETPGMGDIIVTAQKRAENVQSVPLAVSVLGQSQLELAGVRQFQDLGNVAPSLTVRPAEHPVNANVSLRGVGTFAFGIGVEPSVAVLVDEVPLAFQARAFTDLPDVERIEVLRGPQSTLYGKSASAGLINIITRAPTDTLHVRANLLATTDQEYGGNFSISGPISEQLGYIVSGSYSNFNGNIHNLFNNQWVNGREAVNLRGKLRWEPAPNVTVTASANYLNGNTTVGRPFVRMNPNALLRNQPGLNEATNFPGVTISETNQDISNNYNSRTKYYGYGGYIRTEVGLGEMNLVSISSYDKFRLNDYLDQDDTSAPGPYGSNNQIGTFRSRLLTQEVRLLSPGDKPFRYTVGVYYAGVNFERPFYRGPQFSLANWDATSRSRQIAGFVQADWEFLPHATLTGGGRVQNERVSYTFRDNLAHTFYSGSAEDTAGTYRVSLKYELTPTLMLFGTYSTGYKGQTYDLTTGFNANRAAAGPIRPERSRDKEIGARTQFFDRRLTVNLTYFDTTYKDLQAQTIETLSDGTSNYRLTNVGRLNTKGLELDSSARLGDLTLTGSLAYLDAKYTSFPVAQCWPNQSQAQGCIPAVPATPTTPARPAYQDLTGARAIQAPKWKFSVGADYSPSLGHDLRGVAQLNWQYQSSVYYVAEDPETFQRGYHIVNIGLGVRDEQRRWELVGFINNLFDQQYFPSLVNTAGNFGGLQATQAVLPRDFRRYGGLRLGFNF